MTSGANANKLRIGIDLGGTKIEFVALEGDGREVHRHRVATPRNDYTGTIRAIKESVEEIENKLKRSGTVGVGIPGTISQTSKTVKNANSTWLNGRPFDRDLGVVWRRGFRGGNEPNCWGVCKAPEGAGGEKNLVLGVIWGRVGGGG